MEHEGTRNRCLTYVSVPHDGTGWVQICVSLLEAFPTDVLRASIVLPRAFRPISASVEATQAFPHPLPYRYAAQLARPVVNYLFRRKLSLADPRSTIAYFWPSPPLSLLHYARERGFLTVREVINTSMSSAKAILDEAYSRLGLPIGHNITDEAAAQEREELKQYDYLLSPNPRVEKSLVDEGFDPARILRSSYGWLPSSFASSTGDESRPGFRALFIGSIGVRKGIPQLLAAWEKCGVVGELLLVGNVEPPLQLILAPYLKRHDVRLADYTFGLGHFYKSADVFVLPSLEEGDPLVAYEAAGCGLPLIATPMGSANIVKHGVNGLIVEPYDADDLAQAISKMASSPELRHRLARQAAKDAQNYTTAKIGRERAEMLSNLLSSRI